MEISSVDNDAMFGNDDSFEEHPSFDSGINDIVVAETALKAVQATKVIGTANSAAKSDAEAYVKKLYEEAFAAAARAPPKYQLVTHIKQAEGLLAKYKKRTSHPFVTVSYSNSMRRTPTIENTQNPRFDCDLVLPLEGSTVKAPVRAAVWCDIPEEDADNLETASLNSTHSRFTIAPWHGRGDAMLEKTKVRFLGQVTLKASQVNSMIEQGETMSFPLQKRNARSHVKGTIELSFSKHHVRKGSPKNAVGEYIISPVWEPPPEFDEETLIVWKICHDVLELEALRIEAEDADSGQPRSISVPAQRVLDSAVGSLSSRSASIVLVVLLREFVDAIVQNPHAEMEWPQLVALLSFFVHQISYAPIAPTLEESLTCLRFTESGSMTAAIKLEELLNELQVDLEQYKFQFAAHSRIVPPIFDHFLRVFVLSQRLFKYIRPIAERVEERLERALHVCKSKIFTLIWLSAQAEHPDNAVLQQHVVCDMLWAELQYDADFFASYFDRHASINLADINAATLCASMADQCSDVLATPNPEGQSFEIFDLMHKIQRIGDYLSSCNTSGVVRSFAGMHRWFFPHALQWVQSLVSQGTVYAKRAFDLDTGEPLSDRALHSSAVLDLLTFFTQSLYELEELRWSDFSTAGSLFQPWTEMVVATVHVYMLCLRDRFHPTSGQRLPSLPTATLCVAINNIAQLLDGLLDLQQQVEKALEALKKRNAAPEPMGPSEATSAKGRSGRFSWLAIRRPTHRKTKEEEMREFMERQAAIADDGDTDDTDDEEAISAESGRAANVDPLTTVRQSFKLAMQELSGALVPLLSVLSSALETTTEQYLSFLLGFRRSKPILSQAFALESRKSASAKFGPTRVLGLSERRMDKVKRSMERMVQQSRRASWRRHQSKPSASVEKTALKTQRSREENQLLLDEGAMRISMEPLLDFLDENLQLLSENLYEDVFSHVLACLWDACLNLVHRKMSATKSGVISTQQASTLLTFLRILETFFYADGSGLPEERLRTKSFESLVQQLQLGQNKTQQLIWQFIELQCDKVITPDNLSKPSISFQVSVVADTGLHLNDKIEVLVRGCRQLPSVGLRGTINPTVVVTVRQRMSRDNDFTDTYSTGVKDNNRSPTFNDRAAFPLHSLNGAIHLAVYHIEGKRKTFIGEGCCHLEDFDRDHIRVLQFEQPLVPTLDRRSQTILKVLAARKADADATTFVHARMGEVRDRGVSDGGSTSSKLHVVNNHFFRATRYALPPVCAVCQSFIFGIGKAVYECELCGVTVHKRCHIDLPSCASNVHVAK